MFGRELNGDMVPFHTYSLSEAIRDGIIINVLQDYVWTPTPSPLISLDHGWLSCPL